MAMMQLHMKIDGIDGPCKMKGREGTFEVLGLNHEVVLPFEQRNGQPRDKRVHNPVTVMKEVDSASPKLYQAICTAQKLKSVEIKWYKIDDAGKEQEYFNTRLDNVKVVAVKPKMLDIKNPAFEKHNHLEDIELRYEKITWSYKDGNIIHADSWNERA